MELLSETDSYCVRHVFNVYPEMSCCSNKLVCIEKFKYKYRFRLFLLDVSSLHGVTRRTNNLSISVNF